MHRLTEKKTKFATELGFALYILKSFTVASSLIKKIPKPSIHVSKLPFRCLVIDDCNQVIAWLNPPMIMHSCALQKKKSANTVKHPDSHLFQLSTPLKKKKKLL